MKRAIGLAALAAAWSLGGPAAAALGAPSGPTPGQPGSGQLVLVRTDRQMPITGDPIWELQLDLPGQPQRAYEALVGRARHQDGDRDRLGSKAPLPRGRYLLTEITPLDGTDGPELGRFLWIGLEPEFPTARRALGIHHDPSAGAGRDSGTDGCIGLIHGNDLLVLGDLLRRSGTRELLVKD
ncbi:MAG: hypothetical protein ER33_11740 [Cyanobium sp. CACIAM 14]|nr:MAG: hypothetical protein ER33_11740 [Cyanobium sp. CACIAM 14]